MVAFPVVMFLAVMFLAVMRLVVVADRSVVRRAAHTALREAAGRRVDWRGAGFAHGHGRRGVDATDERVQERVHCPESEAGCCVGYVVRCVVP